MDGFNYRYFAVYGTGAYGNCSFSTSTSCTATSTGPNGGTSSGSLANTGLLIAIIATIACLIIFASILVRWWRRPRSAQKSDQRTKPTFESDDQRLRK